MGISAPSVTVPGVSAVQAGISDVKIPILIGVLKTPEVAAFGISPTTGYHRSMDLHRVNEAVPELLYPAILVPEPSMPGTRPWKMHDCKPMDRLRRKHPFLDPVNKASSNLLKGGGLRAAIPAFRSPFLADPSADAAPALRRSGPLRI